MQQWAKWFEQFMNWMVPVAFVVVLLVQLKIMSVLRSHLGLIMFYGKQIEEIRKMLAGGGAKRLPEVAQDESGLYEVLRE